MTSAQAAINQPHISSQICSRWFAVLSNNPPPALADFKCRSIAANGDGEKLYLGVESDWAVPSYAQRNRCAVIFSGLLYHKNELLRDVADDWTGTPPTDAEVVLAAYERSGEQLFNRLRGSFALVLWDADRRVLACLRDPLGHHPLFYAETNGQLLVSPTISVLTTQPDVSAGVNRAALADFILDRHVLDETYFEAVKRVPPGHVLRVGPEGRRLFRYWDPTPNGVVEWLSEDQVERFDELLDRAVNRCLNLGRTGIFLSGGLDSVSIAAVALDQAQNCGMPRPLALSLIFPEPDVSEEDVQRGVAQQLGLPQVLKPFYEATNQNGFTGLLQPGLAMSASLSSPLLNPWLPAYIELAREGKRGGCEIILTGGGGDEWLSVGPFLAADLLREFDLARAYRLWKAIERSHSLPKLALFRNLFWNCGAKPLLHAPAHRLVRRVAPGALQFRRRVLLAPPKWLAPDEALRKELQWRHQAGAGSAPKSTGSFYVDEGRKALDHQLVSWEAEELFEVYARVGVRMFHPYLDPDLLDLLYRTPPFMLLRDGRNKGLVRSSLARRFPQLGFERQRKVQALNFYASLLHREGPAALEQLGGLKALAGLGIVDDRSVWAEFKDVLARKETGKRLYRFWHIINLESWARTHVS